VENGVLPPDGVGTVCFKSREEIAMTRETKHTPGPWRAKGVNFGYTHCDVLGCPHPIDGGDYAPICRADTPENARLIAAAPELLEALEAIKADWAQGYGASLKTEALIDAAIAKAKGK
jgi:hypothetical protein